MQYFRNFRSSTFDCRLGHQDPLALVSRRFPHLNGSDLARCASVVIKTCITMQTLSGTQRDWAKYGRASDVLTNPDLYLSRIGSLLGFQRA